MQCTGVAVRAEFEINVAGGNPVIVVVMREAAACPLITYVNFPEFLLPTCKRSHW